MDDSAENHCQLEDDEEYVMLDLSVLSGKFDIPPNASYDLSGLDTLNPILVIDGKLELIGEYEETIGTCFVFSEDEAISTVHEEAGPSEANVFAGKCIVDSKQAPNRQVKPVARLHKILKFRRLVNDNEHDNDNDIWDEKTKSINETVVEENNH